MRGAKSNLFKHGGHRTPEWLVWQAMLARCLKPTHKYFFDYGGRGIKVCQRWMKFENFLADMGRRPDGIKGKRPLYSIDRFPDKNGNYEPGNVRWATMKEQATNRRPRRPSLSTHEKLELANALYA